MIDLYFWPTPNGQKVSIFLEEAGLPYKVVPVNIGKGEQFEPKFLEISPNNKMPAMVDHEGPDGKPISVFESGAMLMYLAEKDRQVHAHGAARPRPGARMGHVPDGHGRPDAGTGQSLPQLRAGKAPIRD